jgi:hypothetical protein
MISILNVSMGSDSEDILTSDLNYRGEACQHLDLDLVDLEVKCHFRIRKVQA